MRMSISKMFLFGYIIECKTCRYVIVGWTGVIIIFFDNDSV